MSDSLVVETDLPAARAPPTTEISPNLKNMKVYCLEDKMQFEGNHFTCIFILILICLKKTDFISSFTSHLVPPKNILPYKLPI